MDDGDDIQSFNWDDIKPQIKPLEARREVENCLARQLLQDDDFIYDNEIGKDENEYDREEFECSSSIFNDWWISSLVMQYIIKLLIKNIYYLYCVILINIIWVSHYTFYLYMQMANIGKSKWKTKSRKVSFKNIRDHSS